MRIAALTGKICMMYERFASQPRSPMNPTVMQTAAAVRKEVQRWAEALNNDRSIDPTNLRGACGIGSYLLLLALEHQGVAANFVMGHYNRDPQRVMWPEDNDRPNHCWLTIGETIIDITATQFDEEEPVYVTRHDDERYIPLHLDNDGLDILLKDWDDQSPTCYSTAMPLLLNQALQEVSQ